jgi:hypothetical protein
MRLRRLLGNGWLAGLAVALSLAAAACASGSGGRSAASSRQGSNPPCTAPVADPAEVVNANRPALDPQTLQGVVAGMCLSDVLNRVGPAHRYVASTPFQFEWKATDGRTLQVGIPSLRDKVLYVRWSK